MSVPVLPTIKRFFEGTANVVFSPSGTSVSAALAIS